MMLKATLDFYDPYTGRTEQVYRIAPNQKYSGGLAIYTVNKGKTSIYHFLKAQAHCPANLPLYTYIQQTYPEYLI